MTKGGKLIEGIFKGETINTPSMLAVEDYIFALEWARAAWAASTALIARADANAAALDAWVERDAVDRASRRRSGDAARNTSVCLKFAATRCRGSTRTAQRALVKKMAALLEGGGRRLRHRRLSRRAAGPPHLVRRHRRDRRHRGARPLARLGLPRGAQLAAPPNSTPSQDTSTNAQSADLRPDGSEGRRDLPRQRRRGRREARPLARTS